MPMTGSASRRPGYRQAGSPSRRSDEQTDDDPSDDAASRPLDCERIPGGQDLRCRSGSPTGRRHFAAGFPADDLSGTATGPLEPFGQGVELEHRDPHPPAWRVFPRRTNETPACHDRFLPIPTRCVHGATATQECQVSVLLGDALLRAVCTSHIVRRSHERDDDHHPRTPTTIRREQRRAAGEEGRRGAAPQELVRGRDMASNMDDSGRSPWGPELMYDPREMHINCGRRGRAVPDEPGLRLRFGARPVAGLRAGAGAVGSGTARGRRDRRVGVAAVLLSATEARPCFCRRQAFAFPGIRSPRTRAVWQEADEFTVHFRRRTYECIEAAEPPSGRVPRRPCQSTGDFLVTPAPLRHRGIALPPLSRAASHAAAARRRTNTRSSRGWLPTRWVVAGTGRRRRT